MGYEKIKISNADLYSAVRHLENLANEMSKDNEEMRKDHKEMMKDCEEIKRDTTEIRAKVKKQAAAISYLEQRDFLTKVELQIIAMNVEALEKDHKEQAEREKQKNIEAPAAIKEAEEIKQNPNPQVIEEVKQTFENKEEVKKDDSEEMYLEWLWDEPEPIKEEKEVLAQEEIVQEITLGEIVATPLSTEIVSTEKVENQKDIEPSIEINKSETHEANLVNVKVEDHKPIEETVNKPETFQAEKVEVKDINIVQKGKPLRSKKSLLVMFKRIFMLFINAIRNLMAVSLIAIPNLSPRRIHIS